MEVSFRDEPVKGRIKLSKMDAETKELLASCICRICSGGYRDTRWLRHYAKDEFIGKCYYRADGTGSKGNLPLGKYIVRETKAPEGYCLTLSSHPALSLYMRIRDSAGDSRLTPGKSSDYLEA